MQRIGLAGMGLALGLALAPPPVAGTQAAATDWLADVRKYEARREQRERPEAVLAALDLQPGARVADIGAGDGFYSVRLAARVGAAGRVLAVDLSDRAIGRLRERVTREGLTNVDVIQAAAGDPRLGSEPLDAVLIVNAYHEMAEHQAILRQIRQVLRPTGRLVIVEPLDTTLRLQAREQQEKKHSLASGHALADLREAGFGVAALHDPFTRRGILDEEWMIVARPLADDASATAAAAADAADERFLPRHRIAFDEFQRLNEDGEVLVIDVRDAESYREGHIPGAILVAYDKVAANAERLRAETRPIVAYCSCPAEETSGGAVVTLAKHGITNARALVGGYRLWAAKGQPVVKGDSPCDGPSCPLKRKATARGLTLTPPAPLSRAFDWGEGEGGGAFAERGPSSPAARR